MNTINLDVLTEKLEETWAESRIKCDRDIGRAEGFREGYRAGILMVLQLINNTETGIVQDIPEVKEDKPNGKATK